MERAWGVVVSRERVAHAYATLTDEALASLLDHQLERLDLPQLRQALMEDVQRSRLGARESLNTYIAAWCLALAQAPTHLGLTASELQVAHSFRASVFDNQLAGSLHFALRVEVPEVARPPIVRGPRRERSPTPQATDPAPTVTIQEGGNEGKSKPAKARPVRRLNLSRDNEVPSNVPHDKHLQCTNHVDQRLARRRRGASLQWYVDPDEHK